MESPANPLLTTTDLAAVVALAKKQHFLYCRQHLLLRGIKTLGVRMDGDKVMEGC